jgi:mannose-6-phosphate isomerase-like protein (cupin superfamily)
MRFALPFMIGLAAIAGIALAQGQPRVAATDISKSEIDAVIARDKDAPVADKQLRVVSIGDSQYNVAVGIVHRAKTAQQSVGGSEHSQITEVYHVISGTGTLVTGGTLQNAKERAPDVESVKTLTGPSSQGTRIAGGTSRRIGPGDVVIIPPNTPHTFTSVDSDQIVYLVVRVDPNKVLPAGYVLK